MCSYTRKSRITKQADTLGGTTVTMADGSGKQIRDVVVGDRVASWDETMQKPIASTVKAVPTYQRNRSELVEISLPGESFHATADHPFWSRSRSMLVSMHPNMTRDEYDLHAELMSPTEELEGLAQEPVRLQAARHGHFRHGRALRGTLVGSPARSRC